MILCISVFSIVISPFSFLILLIWFFSLCFLMSLANGLSILFILSKKQLLALLIFAMVSFVSFAFISALILEIYFLLLLFTTLSRLAMAFLPRSKCLLISWLQSPSAVILGVQECLTPLWTPSRLLKVTAIASNMGFDLRRGRWQMPLLVTHCQCPW